MFQLTYKGAQLPFVMDFWVQKRLALFKGITMLKDFGKINPDNIEELEHFVWLCLQRGALESFQQWPSQIPYYEKGVDETGQEAILTKYKTIEPDDIEEIFSKCEVQIMTIIQMSIPDAKDLEVQPEDTAEKKS